MNGTASDRLQPSHHRYAVCLLCVFCVVFVLLAWQPWYRGAWLLENLLVFLLLPILIISYRHLPLSRISYTAIFVFLCLHEIGSHYTYAEVPYEKWWHNATGSELHTITGWQRNHFDRLVHCLYGVLITYPIREVFLRLADARGFWGYLFPLLVVMSTSLLFEMFEWLAAVLFGGDLGMAYLGTQGDVWDSHKDSLLASVGALFTIIVVGVIHRSLDRDFSREWNASLTVKHPEPLGEVAIDRLLQENTTAE